MSTNQGTKNHLDELTLSLLVDDMLPQQESAKWHSHIETCKDCGRAYEETQAISLAMLKMETQQPPSDFVEGILRKLPPQDQIDSSKTVEIKKEDVKINFWASLDMRQVGMYAACAVLALSFFYQPPSLNTSSQQSESNSTSASNSATPSVSGVGDLEIMQTMGEDSPVVVRDFVPESSELAVTDFDGVASSQSTPQLIFTDSMEFFPVEAPSQALLGILEGADMTSELQTSSVLYFNEFPVDAPLSGKEWWGTESEESLYTSCYWTFTANSATEEDKLILEFLVLQFPQLEDYLSGRDMAPLLLISPLE